MDNQLVQAGEFTVTLGLSHGGHYIFITHRDTGHQWMSKSSVDAKYDLTGIATNIELGITTFYPDSVTRSCDPRFWMPVKQ